MSSHARVVFSITKLAEVNPSAVCPWRKMFRCTYEKVVGIFDDESNELVPGQPVMKDIVMGCLGMLDNNGRILIKTANFFRRVQPYRPDSGQIQAVIAEFYKKPYFVTLKDGKTKVELFEYLQVNSPEVIAGMAADAAARAEHSDEATKVIKKMKKRKSYLLADITASEVKERLKKQKPKRIVSVINPDCSPKKRKITTKEV